MSEQTVKCPSCGAMNAAGDMTAGDKVVCQNCGRELEVVCRVEVKQTPEQLKFSDGFIATGRWGFLSGGVVGAVIGGASGFVRSGLGGGILDLLLWGVALGVVLGIVLGVIGGLRCRVACKR